MHEFETGIINRANKGGTVKEVIEIIENMGPFHRTLVMKADRDARMSDNLCVALSYIDQHGYNTKFLV